MPFESDDHGAWQGEPYPEDREALPRTTRVPRPRTPATHDGPVAADGAGVERTRHPAPEHRTGEYRFGDVPRLKREGARPPIRNRGHSDPTYVAPAPASEDHGGGGQYPAPRPERRLSEPTDGIPRTYQPGTESPWPESPAPWLAHRVEDPVLNRPVERTTATSFDPPFGSVNGAGHSFEQPAASNGLGVSSGRQAEAEEAFFGPMEGRRSPSPQPSFGARPPLDDIDPYTGQPMGRTQPVDHNFDSQDGFDYYVDQFQSIDHDGPAQAKTNGQGEAFDPGDEVFDNFDGHTTRLSAREIRRSQSRDDAFDGSEPSITEFDSGYQPQDLGTPAGNETRLDSDFADASDVDEDDAYIHKTSVTTRNALEWAVVLVGAILVALLLRATLFQAFWIPSESMESTLLVQDRVLVNKVSYDLHDINRGDVVVFSRLESEQSDIRDLIKRVIGLPGETVEGRDNAVYIDGRRLGEPYLAEDVIINDFPATVIPEGQIFVMGDNRGDSKDSRVFGAIDDDRVVGRAFVRFWPITRFGFL